MSQAPYSNFLKITGVFCIALGLVEVRLDVSFPDPVAGSSINQIDPCGWTHSHWDSFCLFDFFSHFPLFRSVLVPRCGPSLLDTNTDLGGRRYLSLCLVLWR